MTLPIYLDFHASTPTEARVLAAMEPFLTGPYFANAASSHLLGKAVADVCEQARADVAAMVSAQPHEVIFTSGASESSNLAIRGVCEASWPRKDTIVTTNIEHSSVIATCEDMARRGWKLVVVRCDRYGVVDPADIARAIGPTTALVSVISAQNEIGTLQRLREIAGICRERGVLFHTDACQGFCKIELNVCETRESCTAIADLISLSGHKIYGPKGVGALIVRTGTAIVPQITGGNHERGFRAGTLNSPGIVGLGVACRIMREEWPEECKRLGRLRDRMLRRWHEELGDRMVVNGALGDETVRLAMNLNVTFRDVCPINLDLAIRNHVAVSSASACRSAGAPQTSRIIEAIGGLGVDLGATIRVGIGRPTTEDEVDYATEVILAAVHRLRDAECGEQAQ